MFLWLLLWLFGWRAIYVDISKGKYDVAMSPVRHVVAAFWIVSIPLYGFYYLVGKVGDFLIWWLDVPENSPNIPKASTIQPKYKNKWNWGRAENVYWRGYKKQGGSYNFHPRKNLWT